MGKAMMGVVVVIMSYLFVAAHAGPDYPCPQDSDCRPYPPKIIFKIPFYMHIFTRGDCQSLYRVARASITSCSPTNFGSFSVADNVLTKGPDLESGRIGKVQGTLAFADMQRPAGVRTYTIHFDANYYNGSDIHVVDRIEWNPDQTNEASVVGGTGDFRNAKGYGYRTVYSTNGLKGYTVSKYVFYIYRELEY